MLNEPIPHLLHPDDNGHADNLNMKTLCVFVILTGLGYSIFSLDPPVLQQAYAIPPTKAEPIKESEDKPPNPRKMYPAIGSASSESVTTAIEFYQNKNITNVGVAYLVGNFIYESGLKPEAVGDGGLALGIAQWHPERRVGLPGTLDGQLSYAWDELQHYPLKSALYGTDEGFLINAIRRYEGYSTEGNRFMYARQLMGELL